MTRRSPVYCPHCQVDITDTYDEADPSVGVYTSGWWCEDCGEFFTEDDL